MAKELLTEEIEIKKLLAEKYGSDFYELFTLLSFQGIDVKTAIFECWNQLECGGTNG